MLSLAWAQTLELPEVLESARASVPYVEAGRARLQEAEGERLAARGSFDPTLEGSASSYRGKYERNVLDTSLGVESIFGPEVAVGYERGVGEFPAYAEEALTDAEGDLVVTGRLPLLNGLGASKARANWQVARLGVEQYQASLSDVLRITELKASKAYWAWVAAAAQARLASRLVDLANSRTAGLERQVELGYKPRIDLLDNEQALLSRQAKLMKAEQKLQAQAIGLSFYLRDGSERRVPTLEEAPSAWAEDPALETWSERPDLVAARAKQEQLRAKQKQARNGMLPKLDLVGEVAVPLSGEKGEQIASAKLSAPLAFRQGRGELQAAGARVAQGEAELLGKADAAAMEIETARVAVQLSSERAALARQAVERAEETLRLEGRRVELGGSTLFQLVQRETKLGKAQEDLIAAEYELRVALAVQRAAGML